MRLLICRDYEQNTLLQARVLDETENIRYEIIDEAPVIEEKEGYTGKYSLNSDGELVVVYEENPQTVQEQVDDFSVRLAEMQEMMAELALGSLGKSTNTELNEEG